MAVDQQPPASGWVSLDRQILSDDPDPSAFDSVELSIDGWRFVPVPLGWLQHGVDPDRTHTDARVYAATCAARDGRIRTRFVHPVCDRVLVLESEGLRTDGGLIPSGLPDGDWPRTAPIPWGALEESPHTVRSREREIIRDRFCWTGTEFDSGAGWSA